MKRTDLKLRLCGTLVGGLWAICFAMIFLQSESDHTRVHLDKSVPVLILGLLAGYAVGWGLDRLCSRWARLPQFVAPILVAVLVGSIAGPLAWIARDDRIDVSGADTLTRAAAWSACAGLGLFAVWRLALAMREAGTDVQRRRP